MGSNSKWYSLGIFFLEFCPKFSNYNFVKFFRFAPLNKWMAEDALKEYISKAEVSDQLDSSPCAIITSRYVKYIFFLKFKDGWISDGIHSMLRQISTKSHAQAQISPQHGRVSYVGPKSPYIEILKNRPCTMNFQKNNILLYAAAQSARGEQY